MPTGGFIGFAPSPRASGSAGAASMFLTPLVAPQNGIAAAVLLDTVTTSSGISFKAVIYDGSHSALLATGSVLTTLAANYNRFPLTANLNVTAGTTYYVGYVCNTGFSVSLQSTGGQGAWFVSGGQSVTAPANPLVGGASNAGTLMCALELDGTGSPGFGWGPDFTSGVTLATSNTEATLTSAANLGVRSILTQTTGAGKLYAEIDVGGTVSSPVAVGINTVNGQLNGVSLNAAAYFALLSSAGSRTGSVSLGLTYVSGDTIGIAYDGGLNAIWWNKNNGSWFGSSSVAGNPATGSNGYGMTATLWPLALTAGSIGGGTAATFRLRDTSGALRYAPPAGFSAWSTATYPPVGASPQARAMVLA